MALNKGNTDTINLGIFYEVGVCGMITGEKKRRMRDYEVPNSTNNMLRRMTKLFLPIKFIKNRTVKRLGDCPLSAI